MDTIITIGALVVLLIIYIIVKQRRQRKLEKKFPPGTGKKCTITAGKFEWCTPPVQGDTLNGKLQDKKVLYYRELERKPIYEAEDEFKLLGITYEYWDELPIHKAELNIV